MVQNAEELALMASLHETFLQVYTSAPRNGLFYMILRLHMQHK